MTQAQSKSYGGVKKKLVGAVCMLLVASIMMVSSTYAWFTLSTAPEITGISTSVGANGNLEMALLTSGTGDDTNTYKNLDKITSAVGDSVAKDANVTRANLTWGNLVDLKNESYGLDDIKLMPARLSKATDSTAEETKVNHTNLLQIASYGADGRVKDVDGLAVSAVKSGENGFQYTAGAQTYGVRAIGVASDVTQRQITFNNAKSAVSAAADNAGNPFKTAVSKNFFYLALAAMQEEGDYSDADIALMTEVATGAKTTLERITNAYAQAVIAAAAAKDSTAEDDGAVEALRSGLSNITDANTLKKKLNEGNITNYDDQLGKIVTAQASVKTALEALGDKDHTVATIKEKAAIPLIGATNTIKGYDGKGEEMAALNTTTINNAETIHLTGGVAGTISEFTGNLDLGPNPITRANIIIGVKGNTSNYLSDLKTAAEELTAPAGAAVATISDTYGYALDMAFRTNAADSKLQLAGEGVQRVYKDGGNSDTLGKGSTMTFEAEEGITTGAVQKLMEAIRVAFIDPETGKIYGVATLKDMKPGDGGTTGTLTLQDYKFDTDGKLTITEKDPASAELMDLPQNTAVRMTVVVWLDGDTVDNSMVANGAKSLTGSLNLQFSSSAELVPMENSALKNATGTGNGPNEP